MSNDINELLKDPQGDLFAAKAKKIEEKYRDYFNNHPLNTETHKMEISEHCVFYYSSGKIFFAIHEEAFLKPEIANELRALFQEVYELK